MINLSRSEYSHTERWYAVTSYESSIFLGHILQLESKDSQNTVHFSIPVWLPDLYSFEFSQTLTDLERSAVAGPSQQRERTCSTHNNSFVCLQPAVQLYRGYMQTCIRWAARVVSPQIRVKEIDNNIDVFTHVWLPHYKLIDVINLKAETENGFALESCVEARVRLLERWFSRSIFNYVFIVAKSRFYRLAFSLIDGRFDEIVDISNLFGVILWRSNCYRYVVILSF